jgi:hypothetical protein
MMRYTMLMRASFAINSVRIVYHGSRRHRSRTFRNQELAELYRQKGLGNGIVLRIASIMMDLSWGTLDAAGHCI